MRAPRHAGRSARRPRPVRSGLAAALAVLSAAPLACQAALTEHNPASHLVWWVSGILFLVLVVILVVEGLDWLRALWRRMRPKTER